MEYINAAILGVVEGITEFLPISSTAHLLITGKLLGIPNGTFSDSMSVIIQSGALVSVFALYIREIFSKKYFLKIVTAFIPTALVGYFLYPYVHSLFDSYYVIAAALIFGGALIYYIERRTDEGLETISYKQAFVIGFIQSIAIVPGVSRSLATIFGGRMVGLTRRGAVVFSFLLAVPTIFAASAYEYMKNYQIINQHVNVLIVGFLVSFITAYIVIKWLMEYINTKDLKIFGAYRIILGILILILVTIL